MASTTVCWFHEALAIERATGTPPGPTRHDWLCAMNLRKAKLLSETILAIDLGTTTGWACRPMDGSIVLRVGQHSSLAGTRVAACATCGSSSG
jgi:hypothetical protein